LTQLLIAAAIADGLGIDEKLLKRVEAQYGADARLRVEAWDRLVADNRGLSVEKQLDSVNYFFNEVRFISDLEHWGTKDYWSTPVELLSSDGGDCEDFSVAKYFTLRELGVPDEHLRLTYVKAVKLDQAHMVLTYYATPASEPLVLDNIVSEIRPASRRKDLIPVYSFNGDGLWLAKARGQGQKVGKAERLSRWNDLTRRMREHGMAQVE
jgi:predicted transglutaminase-like cysteine proteinase